ncbi:unnamed protein product, partial [marine sediment metagenome]
DLTKGAIVEGEQIKKIQDGTYKRTTTGWRPGCSCDADKLAPCVVLDPFCGSGKTGIVALELRRRFIGFDVNPEYCEKIAAPKLEAARRGLTVSEIESGQQTLFDVIAKEEGEDNAGEDRERR